MHAKHAVEGGEGAAGRAPAPRKLVPPLNFSIVDSGVYRAGYPNPKNFPFLEGLRLRTVLSLIDDPITDEVAGWARAQGIQQITIPVVPNKEPFTEMDYGATARALAYLVDPAYHPILVHCNKGKYRVGSVVGCLRKTQQWFLTSIFEEYARFTGGKDRAADMEFIECFDVDAEHAPPAAEPAVP